MQNANNNFTVESLVTKYRNYVDEHCSKQYVCDDYVDDNGNLVSLDFCEPISPMDDAFEQLLVTLYKRVAGQEADDKVLEKLAEYANVFYSDALTEDEFSFLCEHFADVCSFCFSNLSSKYWQMPTSEQVVELIKKYIHPKDGDTIFVAESGFCDIAILFPNCVIKGYTYSGHSLTHKNTWALTQIRLYSLGITSKINENQDDCANDSYLSDVDFVINGTQSIYQLSFMFTDDIYKSLPSKCKMLMFLDKSDAAGYSGKTIEVRKSLVKDKAIDTLLSYESKNELNDKITENRIFILVDKAGKEIVHLIDNVAGTSKDIAAEMLDSEILWPSYYFAKRPKSGIPLSDLVTFVDLSERTVIKDENGKWILPDAVKQMPVAVPAKMAQEYKDANLLFQKLDLAGDQVFDNNWKFWIRPLKEPCVLLYGNKEKTVVGYINEIPETGIATLDTIVCLIPKEGIDVRYVTTLLLTPDVKEQIVSICQGAINDHTFPLIMNKVIVPNHSDKERLFFLSEANYEALNSSLLELKQEHANYTKAVRMRKHAITQSLSSIEAMFYALNSYREKHGALNNEDVISRIKRTTVRGAFEYIAHGINDMMPALEHIADVEYSFGKPEWLDPEIFIEEYIKKNEQGWLNFKPIITWKQGHNQAIEDLKDPSTGEVFLRKGDSLNLFLFPKDALERVFKNIISNAKAHGFVNKSCNDYQLRFSWHVDGMALIVEIDNNGLAIPNDRDTASLLEYGVSTKLHQDGHNGIGCNEIDDIMQRYDGKVEIVSSPEKDFPVKYILTFNRSNTVRSFKM